MVALRDVGTREPGMLLRRSTAGLLLLASIPGLSADAPTEPSPANGVAAGVQKLSVGETLTRSHGAEERFRYLLDIDGDERLVVEVEQHGLDLIVSSTGPSGARQTVNSPLQRDEREVLVVGGAPGAYAIEIYSTEYTGATGGHAITAWVPDPESGPDWIRPFEQMARGNQLYFDNEISQREDVLAAYLFAAERWTDPGHERDLAWATLSAAGILYWDMTRWREAANLAARAASIYRENGDLPLYGAAIHLQAAALMELANETASAPGVSPGSGGASDSASDFSQAASLLGRALEIQQALVLEYDAARTVNNLGLLAYYRGDWDLAESRWNEAADRFRRLDEWTGELGPAVNLGVITLERGSLSAAVSALTRVLDVISPTDAALRADTLDNRARAYLGLGDYKSALRDFHAALVLHTGNAQIKGQGRSLSGIASAYQGLGDLAEAKAYYERSLKLRESANDGRGIAATLTLLGQVCRQLGMLACAFDAHHRAIAVAPGEIFRARAQIALAVDFLAAEDPAAALIQLEPVIATARRRGFRMVLAEGLIERGKALLAVGEPAVAEAELTEAEALFTEMGMAEMTAMTLYLSARAAAAQGETGRAIALTARSVDQIERIRARLTTPALRATYLSHSRSAYDLQIELLMSAAETAGADEDMPWIRQAFDTAERSRGRMLLDLMDEIDLDLDAGADPILLARRRALTRRMTELAYQRDAVLQEASVDDLRLRKILTSMDEAATDIRVLDIRIREENPAVAAVAAPGILDSHAIQRLLPADTALLLFHSGERRGFVWTLTTDTLRWRSLPGRADLDELAREAHQRLSAYPADAAARQQRDALMDRLGSVLLDPESDLAGVQRLIVIPDGALNYLPFAALPIAGPDGQRRYLLSAFAIERIASGSSMASGGHIGHSDPAPGSVAVFADPLVGGNDPRRPLADDSPAQRQSWLGGLDRLQRLEWSGEEARAIAAIAGAEHSLILTGAAATRDAVLHTDLTRFRYLHFATHSFIDTEYPELSGLVMSRRAGGAPGDGLLQVNEISRLSMKADLVVLSACETALGREIRGEGLVGLTQGFILAGAHQVVASLWRVPDRGTAELMQRLYRDLIRTSVAPADALRQAQLGLAGERRWADPYYWAGFVLQTAGGRH